MTISYTLIRHELEISFKDKKKTFRETFSPVTNKLVTIGRKSTNDIVLNKTCFSRYNTSFFYDEDRKAWFIQDGKGTDTSTNGTWLYLEESVVVKDNLTFRVGSNLLQVRAT